ncbi:unnamed protein product [Kluyveromyces dobzhanskii CBS 2104]|uniref:WGS project CCBQ000000000 data, contig 00106 n=1 Tax=Kluyveromyces dobzhanskii CBS 2104 TaxID=1427455 RepID=A0A0A8L846_9SACH|nr:unnamed protein product [Kluyveromyces dobzhanskii CBS 2104]
MEVKATTSNPDAMDSLLKEIDDEISHTDEITDDQIAEDQTLASEQTPETVSEINESAEEGLHFDEGANNTADLKDTTVDEEDHDFVENTEDMIHMVEDLDSTPLETAWVKYKYQGAKPIVSKRLISDDVSDTSVADVNSNGRTPSYTSEEITGLELKGNMVTDVSERLSHLLDKKHSENPNVPALKEMLATADEKAMDEETQKEPNMTITIESTEPLFPSNDASSGVIQVEIQPTGGDEANVMDSDEANGLLLGSKIPIIPNVSINKFVDNSSQTRVSSGSSIEDAQDLNTHRLQDKYKLLANGQQMPQLPQLPALTLQDFKSMSTQNLNASRIFSVATTNDNYQSAKEFDLSSIVDPNDLPDEVSLRDLEIPESYGLPTLSTFELNPESLQYSNSMETVQYEKIKFNSENVGDDTVEQSHDVSAEPTYPTDQPGATTGNGTSESAQNRQLLGVSDVTHLQEEETEATRSVASDDSRNEGGSEQHTTSDIVKARLPIELPPLPAMNGLSTMFDEDLFNDQETSHESIELTSAFQRENYLSIWHSQNSGSTISPALSTNSQFSSQVRSSSTSTNHSGNSFKFKSRIISSSYLHKRDKFRQPSDEYVLDVQDDSRLDPLRRNTIMSKRIQQELRTQAKMYPFADKSALDESSELSIHEQTLPSADSSRISQTLPDSPVVMPKETLTLLPAESTQTVFSSFLENFGKDDFEEKLAEESRLNSKKNISVPWGSSRDVSSGTVDIKATQQQIAEVLHSQNEEVVQLGSHLQEVEVLQGNEIEGYDVQRSLSDVSLNTTKRSPVRHVGSPFKMKARQQDLQESHTPSVPSDVQSAPANDELTRAPTTSMASVYLENSFEHNPELQDHGKLYLKLKFAKNLSLQQIKHHNARYSLEFDNGKEVVETPWETLPEDGNIKMDQEFEVNMDSIDISLFITLKIRYVSPKNQLEEVVERVPIKKRFGFGKTKYRHEKKYVTKQLRYDEWDFIFAKDGSYARCQVNVDRNTLKQVQYKRKELQFALINEWERDYDHKIAEKYQEAEIWKLPRKQPTRACTITADVMYIPRTSSMERFPKNLKSVEKCCQKYLEQQKIKKEGFLWQEGGDVEGMLKRRYMELSGTELIAHDEFTKKPQTLLNLLNVVDIYVDGKTATGKQMRNFTEMVLFSDCFKLLFSNDEVINFNADSNTLKHEWVQILTRVVELNKFHQPWIKRTFENEQYNIEM